MSNPKTSVHSYNFSYQELLISHVIVDIMRKISHLSDSVLPPTHATTHCSPWWSLFLDCSLRSCRVEFLLVSVQLNITTFNSLPAMTILPKQHSHYSTSHPIIIFCFLYTFWNHSCNIDFVLFNHTWKFQEAMSDLLTGT